MDFIEYILCCQTDVQNIDFVVECLKLGKEIRYWSDIGLSGSSPISAFLIYIAKQHSKDDSHFLFLNLQRLVIFRQ